MSYRCGICKSVVPHGRSRLVHLVKQPDGQIAREVTVCGYCNELLGEGQTVLQPTTSTVTAAIKRLPPVAADSKPLTVPNHQP